MTSQSLAVMSLMLFVLAAVMWTSPALQCARQSHMVYVVDEQACLPAMAFKGAQ